MSGGGMLARALAVTVVLGFPAMVSAQGERSVGVPVSRSAGSDVAAYLKKRDTAQAPWQELRTSAIPSLDPGEQVAVCVTSRRAGYLSVWSRSDARGRPTRIFPNDFTPEQRRQKAGRVSAGQEICFGDGTLGYVFEVEGPPGGSEVYMHWSAELRGQFGPEDMPVIPAPGSRTLNPTAVPSSGTGTPPGITPSGAPYSSTTVRYTVN